MHGWDKVPLTLGFGMLIKWFITRKLVIDSANQGFTLFLKVRYISNWYEILVESSEIFINDRK